MTVTVVMVAVLLAAWLGLPRLLSRPRERAEAFDRFAVPAAHRGLTSPGAPENSLAAFRAAAEAGLAIELDVRACRDGLVVLHDGSLLRMCGVEGAVRDRSIAELTQLHIHGSDERLPTFAQALETVAGRVPLVIELKSTGLASGVRLAQAVAAQLAGYAGAYCVESFNPWVLRACRICLPDAPRGLLVASPRAMRRKCGPVGGWALGNLLLAPLARPHFVAHEQGPLSAGVRTWRRCGGRCAVWTVTDRAGMERARTAGDMAVFEGEEALAAALEWRGQ